MTQDAKKIVKIISISLFTLFIIIYAFFRSRDLIFGVKIRNVTLKQSENIVRLEGNAKNAINLTLLDREISIDQEGNFYETIALLPGYNIVSMGALDKFGNRDEKSYQLILEK
ncbi:hypothetical protein A2933_00290 [Candidatus Nomurabacteria bacterium RIFCSPLOWO2_01_FULL_46_18]|uniref:Uncharacterized protein n=1 Tax=Candidatus Nomurabacteria bacterium RIFCSPLOWO2_01_FULL_46_18 TaxID=1801783 RepID=A0A1F6XCA2_9BACT|nr:MAG: hypothetical protein A2933_00290 [Candidatus Nomurabacteria bacterium RIFCSPLOWO2_01_FULL_46_18]